MAKTLRVHHLAKELGVASKVIIAKCNAEGVEPPLKNHMAAVSIGLAESIREWFSAGEDVTTVEVAQPVDLEKVKKPRRRKKAAAQDEQTDQGGVAVAEAQPEGAGQTAVATSAEPAAATEPAPAETAATVETAQVAPAEAEPATPAVEPIAAQAGDQDVSGEVEREEVSTQEGGEAGTAVLEPPAEPTGTEAETGSQQPPTPAVVEPPKPPEPVKPAGPQVVPAPAELKGPRVVRIEAPEPVRTPRPRMPRTGPRPAAIRGPGIPPPAQPVQGRGGRGRPRGRGRPGDAAARARSPRRRQSTADLSTERLKEWREQDLIERKERLAGATGFGIKARRSADRKRRAGGGGATPAAPPSEVEITTPILAKDFCAAVGIPFGVIFKKLVEHTGKVYRITDVLDADTAELVALDLGVAIKVKRALSPLEKLEEEFRLRERTQLEPRPPVVAMLGHVDHGKTSLLDRIRRTHVADGEAGGITQHIGAYLVERGDWRVTFLDTPGHEAFTAMRARGAHLTDVVVLVVAADDGVMPQTVEAINHAKAAGVQIVVALNKIDLPGVDINRIYAQLAEHELVPTEWGGEVDVVKTSAVTGEGIDDLIAHLSTLSELLDLKADPTVPAWATVIEAQMRGGRGVAAQVLVREGTLKVGDIVVCGPGAGRVRSLLDDRGKRIKQARPGTPVEVVGLDELPDTGESLYQVKDLSQAKQIAEQIREQRRQESLLQTRKPKTLEELLSGASEEEIPELNVIIKADVQGSVDVLKASLSRFPADQARLRILHAAVGAITEADVELARASSAVLIGFHVVAEERARQLAEQYGVEIRLYRVIYEVHDDLHKALEGLLEPDEHEEVRGKVEVRQVFNVSRIGRIAGCFVADGVVARNHRVRVVRDGRIVQEGLPIASLRRFKDDVREVRAGMECGVRIEGFDDLKPGDILETYEIVQVAKKL